MTDDKKIGNQLLRQNGCEPDQLSDTERKSIGFILARDKTRVKRLKWVAAISWIVAIIGYLASIPFVMLMRSLSPSSPWQGATFIYVWVMAAIFPAVIVAFITAVVCTISLYFRSRSVNIREVNAHLVKIEEQLKDLIEKEQSA